MKIESSRTHLLALESVAMTDIVLNMFIFFFISFSLLYTFNPHRVQKLDVKLPKASHTSNIEDLRQVNVTLTNEGLIYVEQDVMTVAEMKRAIARRAHDHPELVVILRADRLVSFKNIVVILDTLSELGITNLNIAAVKE